VPDPIRVQRKRVSGFKLPENTVCVDRTTKYGNPFIVGKHGTTEDCVRLFKHLAAGNLVFPQKGPIEIDKQKSYIAHLKNNLDKLRGKNLACFCKESAACHADVLIELANSETSK